MAAGSEFEVSRRPSLAPPNPSLQRTGRKRPAPEVERSAPEGSGPRGEVAGAQSAMRRRCQWHLRGAVRSFLGGQ